MGKRPRGTCRVCQLQRSGRWDGDVLIVGSHLSAPGVGVAELCPGSDRAEFGEPDLSESERVSAEPRIRAS